MATALHLEATPEVVWQSILFYEEVPRRPLWFLRVFLPRPIRTDGEKMRVGAIVRCSYDGGHLLKRITAVEPARLVRFDVLEQRLGVESCVSMVWGSYEIRALRGGSEVVLTTHYCSRLRPRRLWRPLEHSLAHRLHRHILDGIRASLAGAQPSPAELGRGEPTGHLRAISPHPAVAQRPAATPKVMQTEATDRVASANKSLPRQWLFPNCRRSRHDRAPPGIGSGSGCERARSGIASWKIGSRSGADVTHRGARAPSLVLDHRVTQ